VEGEFSEVRVDGVLRSSVPPKESRGRLDQPLPWIAGPSGYLRLLLAAEQEG
jgi:hypothetical protein